MSKLEELIKEYCPDGVEYKPVGSFIKRERERGKSDLSVRQVYSISSTLGVVRAEEYRENTIFSEDTSGYTILRPHMFAYNPSRLNIGSIAYLKGNIPGLVSPMYVVFSVDESVITVEYLNCLLQSTNVKNKINSLKEEGARFRFDFERWNLIQIPLPPLPVQREIVRILDNFTNLTAEFTAELAARKKQYSFYRDQLLTFAANPAKGNDAHMSRIDKMVREFCPDGVEYKALSESVKIMRGRRVVRRQLLDEGAYPVFQNSLTPLGYYDECNCKADTAYIIVAGAAGEIGYSYVDFWAADDCFYFDGGSDVQNRYLYHVLMQKQSILQSKVRKASIPRLSRMAIENLTIPVPPLPVQREIVSILNRFDALCNDLSSGLPAEIEARQKQYEYYRDKLLTFKPLS